MNLPEIPSDNLYKFMALTGFVSLLTIMGYWLISGRDSVVESFKLRYQIEAVRVENEYLSRARDSAKALPKEQELTLLEKQKDVDLKEIEFRRDSDIQDYLNTHGKIVGWMLAMLAAGSFTLTITGFTLWYQRLQIFWILPFAMNQKSGPKRCSEQLQASRTVLRAAPLRSPPPPFRTGCAALRCR